MQRTALRAAADAERHRTRNKTTCLPGSNFTTRRWRWITRAAESRFFLWALVSFLVARHRGRLISGVAAGLTIALGTFLVYDLLILVRVNLFLDEPTGRADWQDMMARFQASGVDSLRLFVNVDYLTGAPLKLGVSCTIGAIMGVIGGSIGALAHRRTTAAA